MQRTYLAIDLKTITRVRNAPLATSTRLPQIWSWQIPPALRKLSVSLCLLP